MTDYELYLVKKAYSGSPMNYDPYEIYNNKKLELLNEWAAKAPKWTHDNARRMSAEVARKKILRDILVGGGIGAVGGGGYVFGVGRKFLPTNMLLLGAAGNALKYGLGGALAGGLYGGLVNKKTYENAGWDEGDKIDRQIFQDAMKKYEADKQKALDDFNMKYTGSKNPNRLAIYKGGTNIYNELMNS